METQTEKQAQINALASFLEVEVDEISEGYDEQTLNHGSREYLVLTDSEADERATEWIKESVWAFNASFLSDYTGLPEEMFRAVQDKCEGANDAILQCIEQGGGLETFVEEAIASDGRGHFLAGYDGEENEEGDFYIYRIN